MTFSLAREPSLEAKKTAFPYQREAAEFVAAREYAAIFHEQGLGKTKIAIDVLLSWLAKKELDTVVIFTKKILVANWRREIAVHTHIVPAVLGESSKDNYYVFMAPTRLVIAHFEAAKKELPRLKVWLQSRRVGVFLDESAKIKNPEADLTKAFFELAPFFKKRVVMTGTPVANRPYDVWAQIFFLDQGLALGGDFGAFKRETDLSEDYAHDKAALSTYSTRLEAIHEKLASFSVRETKDGGQIVLPSKIYSNVTTTWEPTQLDLYYQVKEELRATVLRGGELVTDEQESVLKRLLRLVQIASNPALIDEGYEAEPGKLAYLMQLVADAVMKGEKVIVWTGFNANCEYLTKKLSNFGSLALHGKLPMDRRNAVVKWFMENKNDQVLVATPGAAKEGLTLTVANHVIFFDRGYSLDDYLQAQDRIHRVSQTRTCYVTNLVMQDSVDEWIDALLEEKRLAAQLAQGDIDASVYSAQATLGFYDILKNILR